jgi:hypothetical protein
VPTAPFGSDVVVIVNTEPMVRVRFAVACAGEPESVALKVNGVALAVAVGVPLIRPDDAFRVRPAGRVPEVNCQLYDSVPPVAASVWEYGVPTAPFGSDVVATVNWETMVKVGLTVAACAGVPESVALKVNGVALAVAVGVPLIRPDDAVRVRPAGSVPEVNCQVTAPLPPADASVWE